MAHDEFWQDIRQAAGMMRPPVVGTDSPRLPPDQIARRLALADLWLTPAIVSSYDEKDFAFLPAEERERLTAAVSRFRHVADQVGPKSPATREQADVGRSALRSLVELMEYDRYQDSDSYRMGKEVEQRLREHGWPSALRELHFSTGGPFSDPPLFNVTAVLKEEELKTEDKFLEQARLVRWELDRIAEVVAPEWFAHIMCRTDRPLTEYQHSRTEKQATADRGA